MIEGLPVALLIFIGSAAVIILGGVGLARYGDMLADRTGLGHLWVGSVLVAATTSLPELFTNISAASIDAVPLALGNIFGANMANMVTLAAIGVVLGTQRLFQDISSETSRLAAQSPPPRVFPERAVAMARPRSRAHEEAASVTTSEQTLLAL